MFALLIANFIVCFLLVFVGVWFISAAFRRSGCLLILLTMLWTLAVSSVMIFVLFKIAERL